MATGRRISNGVSYEYCDVGMSGVLDWPAWLLVISRHTSLVVFRIHQVLWVRRHIPALALTSASPVIWESYDWDHVLGCCWSYCECSWRHLKDTSERGLQYVSAVKVIYISFCEGMSSVIFIFCENLHFCKICHRYYMRLTSHMFASATLSSVS